MSYARGRGFSALGASLMGLGADAAARKERDAARAEEGDWREQQVAREEGRWQTQLRMMPGVEEAPDTVTRNIAPPTDLPELKISGPLVDEPVTETRQPGLSRLPEPSLDVPDFGAMTTVEEPAALPEGRTRIAPGLAFNTRHQEDAAARERDRLRTALAGLEHLPEPSRDAIAAGVPPSVALPTPDRLFSTGTDDWSEHVRRSGEFAVATRAPRDGTGPNLDAQHLIALRQQVNAAQTALERIDRTGPYQGESSAEFQARRQAVLRARGYASEAELARDAQLVRGAGAGVLGASATLPEPERVGPTRDAASALSGDTLAARAFGAGQPGTGAPSASVSAEERREVAELLKAFPGETPRDVLRGVGYTAAQIRALGY